MKTLAIIAIIAASMALVLALEPDCGIKWKAVSKGGCYHTIAIKDDGTLWGWGDNVFGQVGDGSTAAHIDQAKMIDSDTTWTTVSAGCDHSLAIKQNGDMYAWGHNHKGQLGDGTNDDQKKPKQVGAGTLWRLVFADGTDSSFAIDTDGKLWAFGDNGNGQLGIGKKATNETKPVQVGKDIAWDFISPGNSFTLGIQSGDSLYAWGDNSKGQLGDGTTDEQLAPIKIGNDKWKSVAAGVKNNAVGIPFNGSLLAWGCDFFQCVNTTVRKLNDDSDWEDIYLSEGVALGTKTDKTFWGYGINDNGQLGNGMTDPVKEPTKISSDADWDFLAGGTTFSKGLKNKILYTWGFSTVGALGYGDSETVYKFPDVCSGDNVCTASSVCGPCDKGTVKIQAKCEKCADGCAACTQTQTHCTECTDGNFLEGTTCKPCDTSCATCKGSATKCQTCKDGKFLNEKTSTCDDKCDDNCKTCKDKTTYCTACNDTLFVSDKHVCEKCDETCATCTETAKKCSSCKAGAFLNDTTCTPCLAGCLTCQASADNCQSCKDGYFLKNLTASTNDETKTTCGKCDDKCKTCNNTANFCTACADSSITPTATGECAAPPPKGCQGFLCPVPILLTLLGLLLAAGGVYAFIRYKRSKQLAPGEGLLDADNADYTEGASGVSLEKLGKA